MAHVVNKKTAMELVRKSWISRCILSTHLVVEIIIFIPHNLFDLTSFPYDICPDSTGGCMGM